MSTTTPQPQQGFLDLLEASRTQLAALLPKSTQVDRVIRIVRTAWLTNPSLRSCEAKSILLSVLRACELGLEPGGARGHAYLVPFRGRCQLVIGYQGLLALAWRSGRFCEIGSRVVHERDDYSVAYHPHPIFRHVPYIDGDPGPPRLVYAYATLTSGGTAHEHMSHAEIEAIRLRSPEPNSPAWRDYWNEKARNVVLKRLLKRLPLSADLAAAIDHDNLDDAPYATPGKTEVTVTRTTALADHLAHQAALLAPTTEHAAEDVLDTPVIREPGDDE